MWKVAGGMSPVSSTEYHGWTLSTLKVRLRLWRMVVTLNGVWIQFTCPPVGALGNSNAQGPAGSADGQGGTPSLYKISQVWGTSEITFGSAGGSYIGGVIVCCVVVCGSDLVHPVKPISSASAIVLILPNLL